MVTTEISPLKDLERKKRFFDKIGYYPTEKQWYMHTLVDWGTVLLAGGVRFGKSLWTAMELAYLVVHGGAGEKYWLVGRDYSMTKPEWEYLEEVFRNLNLLAQKPKFSDHGKPSKMLIGFKNAPERDCMVIETKSANDNLKLAGFPPKAVVMCEAAQSEYETYLKSLERISEKRRSGSKLILTGSFEGSLGWYPELFNRWRDGSVDENTIAVSCPSWENTNVFPEGRHDPAIIEAESKMTRERFMERYGGEPCPPEGAVMTSVFREFVHVNEQKAYFDSDEYVYLGIDPGWTHPGSVMAVQFHEDEDGDNIVRVIDEVYTTEKDTDEVIDIVEKKWWWPAVHKTRSVIDQEGYFRRQQAPPAAELWRKRTGISLKRNKVPREEGVDLLKRKMKVHLLKNKPELYVHPRCRGFIAECGGGPNPLNNQPSPWMYKKDRFGNVTGFGTVNDDSCKALIYLLWDYEGYARKSFKRAPKDPIKTITKHVARRW